MKNPTNKVEVPKSKALRIFEYALLVFYLGVIILRVIYTEGPTMQMSAVSVTENDSLYSLLVSSGLFFSFVIWVVWNCCGKKFSYRSTGIGLGLLIFGAAAIISGFAASDKRLAMNNIVMMFAPIFCAILLIQIIDSTAKFRLVLSVVAALGVVCTYQCVDQLLLINRETVKEYEQNPDTMLDAFNIQRGTLRYFLFEQRVYSNNARAYFTTRNSAGSFFLLAYFACAALITDRLLRRKKDKNGQRKFYISDIIVIILAASIFLTKSKGAIIGLLFAMALLASYLKFADWMKIHRKIILAAFVLLIAAGTLIISLYGLTYHTLPGGNSMLVRWQYWHASASMFMNHFWKGVGPGNFSIYYPDYKPAAALESVSDPHNFALNILTQYGLLGLIGFLLMIFLPLWRITRNRNLITPVSLEHEEKPLIGKTAITVVLCVWLGFLIVRAPVAPALRSGDILVIIYILLRYCTLPVAVFTVSLILLRKYTDLESGYNGAARGRSTVIAIQFCAMLGVLLHNLTDYAIFESGIYTTFWFLLATLIAINANNTNQPKIVFFNTMAGSFRRIIRPLGAISLGVVICALYLNYAIFPVARSTKIINLANKAYSLGQYEEAHNMLDAAAQDDKLSPYALSLNARMYIQDAQVTPSTSGPFLLIAQSCLRKAIARNNAGYQNFEELSGVCLRLSEVQPDSEKAGWLDLAFDFASDAVNRYPGSGRLHFNLAQIADKAGKMEIATDEYNKAVEIEDQYRAQFHEMFPNEEVVSRLGSEKYQYAKKRIAEIAAKSEA